MGNICNTATAPAAGEDAQVNAEKHGTSNAFADVESKVVKGRGITTHMKGEDLFINMTDEDDV